MMRGPGLLLWALAAVMASSCAWWDETAAVKRAGEPPYDQPRDDDPGSLVPAGVQTVIDADMAQLRRSPWVIPALEARDQRVRVRKEEALGYDDVADVDRLIYAVTAAGADAPTLVVAQGRFQAARVQDAFRARWPAAVVDRWRGILVLASGENAIALLTARTFVSGAPGAVRAVIDRAFGVGVEVGGDPALGPVRRALCPEGRPAKPALLAVVAVDERIRARVGDVAPVPRELRQIGLRLDLGQSLTLEALGILEDREAAAALARRLNGLLTDPLTRLTLRAMGLGMLLTGTRLTADGARVLGHLSVADEHRPQLSTLLKTAIQASGGDSSQSPKTLRAPDVGPFGSW